MYKIDFLEYNDLTKQVLSEKDTLQNIIDLSLNGKPSKEEKLYLTNVEDWAKYAFEKNDLYYIVVYKQDKLHSSISVTDMTISIDFFEEVNSARIKGLTLVYHRFDLQVYLKTDNKKYFKNRQLFLAQIESYDRNVFTRVSFNNVQKSGVITMTASDGGNGGDLRTEKRLIDVNTSNNFIRSPENYKDFIYLLDYKKNIESKYFDLERRD